MGEALGHEGDRGQQDHGFVAGGQALVVAGAAAVCADPGQGAFHHPAAGQDVEGTVSAARTDWESMTAALGWESRPATLWVATRNC